MLSSCLELLTIYLMEHVSARFVMDFRKAVVFLGSGFGQRRRLSFVFLEFCMVLSSLS